MTLLAAFKLLLARVTGADDIVVGITASGRGRVELEDLVGLFVNPLALRTDLSGDPTFAEVLGRVRRTTLEALDHQDAPFDKVVERIRPPRDLSRNPVIQVAFEFRDYAPAPADLGGLVGLVDVGGYSGAEYGAVDGEGITARLDLELLVEESADGALEGTLVYATDLFDGGHDGPPGRAVPGLARRGIMTTVADLVEVRRGHRTARMPLAVVAGDRVAHLRRVRRPGQPPGPPPARPWASAPT